MSRRDRSGGSGLSRGVPRQGPRGRDRAGGTAGAPEERAGLIDRPGVFDDDTAVTTRARDLDRLVAELRDLEAYNQRQERTLRRAQRAVDRERRSQLDGTAVALERSSDGFFGSTGGGRSGDHHRALDHEFTAASSRGGSRQRARDSRHARRRGVPASTHRHLRRESTDFVPSDDLDDPIQIHQPAIRDDDDDDDDFDPRSYGVDDEIRVDSHRVRVIEDELRADPFELPPTFATPQHRRQSLADEVGELTRRVSALTRYVERLGATPPRLVSRGGAFGARHGTYGGSFGGRDASLSVRRSANSDGGGGGGGGGSTSGSRRGRPRTAPSTGRITRTCTEDLSASGCSNTPRGGPVGTTGHSLRTARTPRTPSSTSWS